MTEALLPLVRSELEALVQAGCDLGDAMADMDFNVGLVLAGLKRMGIERNTLVFWCTDNGAEARRPWRGTASKGWSSLR